MIIKLVRGGFNIGKINAKQVRIYKLTTFDCFTEQEDLIYNENKDKSDKDKIDLLPIIQSHKEQRIVNQKCLYIDDENKTENTWRQIAIFESDVVRLALGDNQPNRQLVKEIVFMEIHHIYILKQIIFNGIKIDGVDYILYAATSGQVRDNTITLIEKNFYEKNKGYLMVGLTEDIINVKKINMGKYLTYIALSLSSSVLLENEIDIDRCIVVKGLKTEITDEVKFVDIDNNLCIVGTPEEYVEKEIAIEHTDGSGIFLPGKQPSSFQIRSGHFKGAMFPFDFLGFAKEIAQNTVIKDAWNNDIDIVKDDIQYIFTTSQFKMWDHYTDWNDYKKQFKDYGVRFTVNSWANPPKEKTRGNYQVYQTLPQDSDITKICEYTVDRLVKLHTDLDYVKKEMGLDMTIPDDENSAIKSKRKQWESQALDIYPQLIYDDYIQNEIKKLYVSELHKAKGGKIFIDGYYSYAAPDMYAFCEFLFMKEANPEGLVLKGHVYNKYYSGNENIAEVCLLRSPHLTKYEHPKKKLIKNELCNKWFGHMESDTVVSCHDLISKSLQMDWDGDELLISPDPELLRLSVDTSPLYYDMDIVEAKKVDITKDNIFETLKNGFENNIIGEISNAITKLWNQDDATESDVLDNAYPYDDLINVLCAYSNFSIDYPKKGKNIDLGDYATDYKKLTDNKSKIKLPNFFIETKSKKSGSVAKINSSVVNRMKSCVIKKTNGLKYEYFKCEEGNSFDYTMLMNQSHEKNIERYRYSKRYNKMRVLLKDLIKLKSEYNKKISQTIQKKNTDGKDIILHFDLYHYVCTQKISKLFKDDMILAANCIVDLVYFNHELGQGEVDSRIILWDIMGHILIDNLVQNKKDGKRHDMPRSRLGYRKGLKGDAEANKAKKEIDEEMEKRKVKITQSDYEFLINNLSKKKSGKD